MNSVLEEQKGGGVPAESAQKPAESMKEEPKKEETVTAAKAKTALVTIILHNPFFENSPLRIITS